MYFLLLSHISSIFPRKISDRNGLLENRKTYSFLVIKDPLAGCNRFEMDPFDLNDIGEAVEMVLESTTSPIGNITPSNEVESATIYSMALNDTTNQSSVPAPSVSNDTGDDTGDARVDADENWRRAVCSVFRDSVKEYSSTRAAAEHHGVSPQDIHNAIWLCFEVEGLRWRYTDETMREKATNHSHNKGTEGGKIWSCDKDSGVDVYLYESVRVAAEALGTNPVNIWVARIQKRATAGYRWRFDGDDIEMPDEMPEVIAANEKRAAAKAEKQAAKAEMKASKEAAKERAKEAVIAEKQAANAKMEEAKAEMEAAKEAVNAEKQAANAKMEAAKAKMEEAKAELEAAKEAVNAEKQAAKTKMEAAKAKMEAVKTEMEANIAIIEAEKKETIAVIEATY